MMKSGTTAALGLVKSSKFFITGIATAVLGVTTSTAQVSIEYVNSQYGQWGAGITAHPNVPTLESAEALILSDLRNVEPLSPALGGRPGTRFYTFEGISRSTPRVTIYSYKTNVFDYRYWNTTHWNCWQYNGFSPVPESFPELPDYILAKENSGDPQQCVRFIDVHYTSGLYPDPTWPAYLYRADLSITRDDGRTYADQVRARQMRALVTVPSDPKNLGCKQGCIGDGVSPAIANVYLPETDFAGPTVTPLRWSRSYNSAGPAQQSGMGSRWLHNYSAKIAMNLSTVPPSVNAYRADGRVVVFNSVNGVYQPDPDVNDRLTQTGSGWQYTNAETEDLESYDASGTLLSITDRSGRTQTLAYAGGVLQSISDAYGRQITLAYDGSGRIATVTTPAGDSIAYTYNGDGLVSTVTLPGVPAKQYLYNEGTYTGGNSLPSALTGVIDENGGRYVTYTYDSTMRPIAVERANGTSRYTFAYISQNSIVTFTDPLNMKRNVFFQTVNWTVRNTSASYLCPHCNGFNAATTTYDTIGNVISKTDYNGTVTCYAYDIVRNLETARAEGIQSGETCSTVLATLPSRVDVRKISTQWHAAWRLPTKVAEPNRVSTYTYNGDGGVYCAPTTALVNGLPIPVLCKRTVQQTTDTTGQAGLAAAVTGSVRAWTYTYDQLGNVLTATDPRAKTTTTVYYAANDPDFGKRGNVYTVTNAAGHVTTITAYDGNGRPLSMTDPNGAVTTLTYHPRGWLKTRTVAGEQTVYDYDSVGQLTRVTKADASYVQYTYDGAHRLTQLQDGLGNKIAYTLDGVGNRVKEEIYDPAGQLARTSQAVYDNYNLLHQRIGAR